MKVKARQKWNRRGDGGQGEKKEKDEMEKEERETKAREQRKSKKVEVRKKTTEGDSGGEVEQAAGCSAHIRQQQLPLPSI